jgi:hypothetical protein
MPYNAAEGKCTANQLSSYKPKIQAKMHAKGTYRRLACAEDSVDTQTVCLCPKQNLRKGRQAPVSAQVPSLLLQAAFGSSCGL